MKCLVIVLDSCQPAYVGCYGNDWLATPTLDQLAAEAVVFDQHFAAEPTPPATRWNWLTGRYAAADRTLALYRFPELLWERGVQTAVIADERSPSLGRLGAVGWEEQHWIRRSRLPEIEQETLLGGSVQTAIEWLRANGDGDDWLLWLELAALHPPWDPATFDAEALEGHAEENLKPLFGPEPGPIAGELAERAAATYAGVVSGVDQWLGMLFDALREQGLHEQLLIIVTGDQGLPLGEHGILGPMPPRLHEELVHLPLLVRLPEKGEAGRRVHQLTQSIDLMPTLLEAFDLEVPDNLHGRSLLHLTRGEPGSRRDYLCSHGRSRSSEEWSIRTHGWYLCLPGIDDQSAAKLCIKPEDRWEANDVCSLHPEVAEHLELTLRRFQAAVRADRLDQAPELRADVLKLAQK
jgi:hypothetical protein